MDEQPVLPATQRADHGVNEKSSLPTDTTATMAQHPASETLRLEDGSHRSPETICVTNQLSPPADRSQTHARV